MTAASPPIPYCVSRGAGEVLLFLHGMGGGHESWSAQLDSFAPDYCAAAWDAPGHGASAALEPLSFATLAHSLAALLDDRGWARVHLVGHSMGGMVAQQFAVDHQHRLHSLTLSGTSPAFGPPDGAFQKKFIARALAPLDAGKSMAEIAALSIPAMMAPDPDPRGRATAIACMARSSPATYRAALRALAGFDQRANLARIHVPTLVLAGANDANAPAAMMERMAAKIPGASFVCLAGLGHLANLERPAAFDAALRDFLDHV
jgi:3-oxoadipate enol-lactonase